MADLKNIQILECKPLSSWLHYEYRFLGWVGVVVFCWNMIVPKIVLSIADLGFNKRLVLIYFFPCVTTSNASVYLKNLRCPMVWSGGKDYGTVTSLGESKTGKVGFGWLKMKNLTRSFVWHSSSIYHHSWKTLNTTEVFWLNHVIRNAVVVKLLSLLTLYISPATLVKIKAN